MTSQPQPPNSRSLKVPISNATRPVPQGQHQLASTQSYLAIFLTNIRLLDLDLRPDWPDITAITFSTKDAQQNQKKRIQCVEWALYQLFTYWDPEETRNKLQPFFPPLEPLQSINLRAALFRCLDQAKKRGVLGRDAVLRKTMLDECKGERLEEVLAVFSTAVVKRVVQEEHNHYGQPIAVQLAMENFSYTGERTVLAVLNLAHRGVISKDLRQKQETKAKLLDFKELLEIKERQIVRRREQLKESKSERGDQDSITAEESERLLAKVEKNWSGNTDWLQTVLHGDGRFEKDSILAQPFDEVWKQVTTSSVAEVEEGKKRGLLDHLDARVKQQNHRLAKWQDFQKSFSKETEIGKTPSRTSTLQRSKKGINLNFGAHETLQMNQNSTGTTETPKFALSEDYSKLVAKIEQDINEVGRVNVSKDGDRSPRKHQSPFKPVHAQSADEIDDIKYIPPPSISPQAQASAIDADEDNGWDSTDSDQRPETKVDSIRSNKSKLMTHSRRKSEKYVHQSSPFERFSSSRSRDPSEEKQVLSSSRALQEEREQASIPSMPPPPKPVPRLSFPPSSLRPDSEAMADEILSSMATASPSPIKPTHRHTLSLAERTRMSMFRGSQSDFDDLPDPFTSKRNSISTSKPTVKTPDELDPHADLISRTRQSMAGFAAAQKKAEIDRRRSVKAAAKKSRESNYFPPPFAGADDEELVGSSSLGEGWEKVDRAGLIEGDVDADYESVFKSRPKIALSPAVSPMKWDLEEEEELEGFEEESSPLRRLGR